MVNKGIVQKGPRSGEPPVMAGPFSRAPPSFVHFRKEAGSKRWSQIFKCYQQKFTWEIYMPEDKAQQFN